MALKRKRSSITSASSSSSSDVGGTFYSAPSPLSSMFFAQSKPLSMPFGKRDAEDSLDCQLNSRTRKRYRDNRPDEQIIFGMSRYSRAADATQLTDISQLTANTISKLYDAQRRLPDTAAIPSPDTQMTPEFTQPVQRNTLHSFWKVNQPACATPSAVERSLGILEMRCEDCDTALRSEDAMELDDSSFRNELTCRHCCRMVCDGCALIRESRMCLSCATQGYS
jgi:hypothetical protein